MSRPDAAFDRDGNVKLWEWGSVWFGLSLWESESGVASCY